MKAGQPLLLFDVDGVLLKENGYYRTLAVTCAFFYEKLCAVKNVAPLSTRTASIRSLAEVDELQAEFLPPLLLEVLRKKAINSNWDKTFAIVSAMQQLTPEKLSGTELGKHLYAWLSETPGMGADYLQQVQAGDGVGRISFAEVKAVFQRFHLEPWPENESFQAGMVAFDETTVPPELLRRTLEELTARGMRLGVGTGRPAAEVEIPFKKFGLYEYFDEGRIITIDHVRRQELAEGLPAYSLAKPHPYTYLLAASDYCREQVYVVGDSPSDQMAANRAGFHFIGVGKKESFAGVFADKDSVVDSVPGLPARF